MKAELSYLGHRYLMAFVIPLEYPTGQLPVQKTCRSNSSNMSKLSPRNLGQGWSRVWRRALDSILIFF